MKKPLTILILILFTTGIMIGCDKNPPVDCSSVNARFAADILPLIQASCATGSGCHASGSTRGPGALTNFSQIKNAASSIKSAVESRRMPIGATLSSSQINQIKCWVDNGALNN